MYIEEGNLLSIDAWEKRYGAPSPLGVTLVEEYQAYNFALYSRDASEVTLLLYNDHDFVNPVYQFRFDYLVNKTGRVWHCWVPLAQAPDATVLRLSIDGPREDSRGQRFDRKRCCSIRLRARCSSRLLTVAKPARGPVPPPAAHRWAYCRFRRRRSIGAAMCARATRTTPSFTSCTSRASPPDRTPASRRISAALLPDSIEKIPYLKDLGVTVVELMPIQQFDPQEGNYWGYMTLNFFAPHRAYASGDPHDEFRAMVKAFHEAGIEVWLDVVYNHTCEGDQNGPTYSYRGIDNASYYLLQPDRRYYLNDTGCGNTLRCANVVVRSLVQHSLEYYTDEMHVDGFRFDLASIFTRSADGSINNDDPAIINEISLLAHARDVSVTAEAWDIGTYQLGRSFPGLTWHQWNGQYRDDLRSFVKSDAGKVPTLMRRLYGSDDLLPQHADRCLPSRIRP